MYDAKRLLSVILFAWLSVQFVFATGGTNSNTQVNSESDMRDSSLIYAAGQNDLDGIKSLLHRGANPNHNFGWATKRPVTALSRAVSRGCYEASKLLLENGASPNVSGYLGNTEEFLINVVIIQDKDLRLLELLLSHNADPNFEIHKDTTMQYTPLHVAAALNSIDAVKMLLKHGANINAAGSAKNTPLFFAAANGHKKLGLFLLSKGANIDFFSACALWEKQRVKEMLDENPKLASSTDNRINRASIFFAVRGGDEEVVRTLIDYGAKVNARAPDYSPIELIPYDTVCGKDNLGGSPLHTAAEFSGKDIIKLLVRSGADLKSRDNYGRTPLMVAVKAYNREAIKTLLEAGANVNAVRDGGWSPLTLCIEHCPDMLPLILEYDLSKKQLDSATEMLKVRDDLEDREKKLELIREKRRGEGQ